MNKFKEFYEGWEANNKKKCVSSRSTDFRIRKILKIVKKFNLKTLHDVGCGYGFFAKLFYNNDLDISASDISKTNVQYAIKNNVGPNYFVHDFETNGLKDKYDLIYNFDVIEHVYDYEKFVQNCYDSLNSRGFLFISTQNAYAPKRKFNFIFNREHKLDFVSKHHIHFFGPNSLKLLLKKIGFKNVKLIGSGKLSWLGIQFSGNMLSIAKK